MKLWAAGSATGSAWVDAAIDGDVQAFTALCGRCLERAYRHAYYLLADRAAAEDLTQRACLEAWRTVSSLRGSQAPFAVWLLACVHRLLTSPDRRAAASPEAAPAARRRWSGAADESPAGHRSLIVRRAILRLEPEQRQVVALRFVEGFACADVAAALGQSEHQIRVIQHGALTEVRLLLESEVDRA